MVTAKVRGLLFEAWWRERVVAEKGASVALGDLFADYRRECSGSGMSLTRFEERLRGVGARVTMRRSIRNCAGFRLRTEEDGAAFVAALAAPTPWPSSSPPAPIPPAVPLFRVTPYNPGEAEPFNATWLEVRDDGDAASAAIVGEVYIERRRQRMPVDEGGEGRSAEHDDREYVAGELERAAATYAFAAGQRDELAPYVELNRKEARLPTHLGTLVRDFIVYAWPWHSQWWKPKTETPDWRRRCMVKAGALLIAALEAHDRRAARGRLTAEEQRQATGV